MQRTFTITFSAEEWNNIKPVTNVCKRKRKGVVIGDRPYLTLKPGQWTSTVFEHFHLHTRLPCRITFKRNQVTDNGLSYVKVEGHCTNCESYFAGEVVDKPDENEKYFNNLRTKTNYNF